ncbi:hypothetical protein NXS19_003594 [Fusarium pseudograminearum]|nr:hypothetical protein NXS19_003594 [Fusarium pseudograminearum]
MVPTTYLCTTVKVYPEVDPCLGTGPGDQKAIPVYRNTVSVPQLVIVRREEARKVFPQTIVMSQSAAQYVMWGRSLPKHSLTGTSLLCFKSSRERDWSGLSLLS